MHWIRLLVAVGLICNKLEAQEKLPVLFRYQQKKTNQHIHRYLQHDTSVCTASATVHVYYSKQHTKPYLLLLHGMGVDAKTNWYNQVAFLSRHFNLILPDLIYFGGSKSTSGDFSVEFQARQIEEVLLQLGINEKIHMMGFSYGALVAGMYSELYPERLTKLVLVDGPLKFFSTTNADSLAKQHGAQTMGRIIVPQNLSDFKAMQKAVISRKFFATARFKKKIIRYYFTPTQEFRQAQLNYLAAHQAAYQAYNYNLDKIPTLLVWGANDGVVPLRVGQDLHARFPHTTRLVVFKKAKHDVHFRCAKALNREVLKFLTE